MFKKTICWLLLLSFLNLVSGCYSEEEISKEKMEEGQKITEVILPSGEVIKFDDSGGALTKITHRIKGTGLDSLKIVITPNGVLEFRTKLYPADTLKLAGVKIAEVTWENKTQYIFDENGGSYQKEYGVIKGRDIQFGDRTLLVKNLSAIYISKPDTVSLERLQKDPGIRIKQVVYSNRIVRTFNDEGGVYYPADYYVTGKSIGGKDEVIKLEDILYAEVQKTDALNTTFAVLGGCLGAGLVLAVIIAATKKSCPFVYSFDGEKYVFDTEPLGGATSKGLKRKEFSRLEFLKETEGKYKLRVVNEFDETQYIDQLGLYVVDHPSGTEAVMNNDGKVYLTGNLQSPLTAADEKGRDISKFTLKEDGVKWQTKMPVRAKDKPGYTRNQLNFSFLRTAEGDTMNLVINAGTSLWGSNMIEEMLKLYGTSVDEWYEKIDQKKSEYNQMMDFLQREELYELKIYLKEKSGWSEKTIIQGGGPFSTERRIVPIDISKTEGDTIFLQVNPPCGFWTFDYLAAADGQLQQVKGTDVSLTSAVDYKGADISALINTDDESYYEMPETGNMFDIEFDAPELRPDIERTVFLKSSGYYTIHLPKDKPADYAKLYEIGMVPGSIVFWSYDKFIEWYNEGLASGLPR